MFNGDPNEVSSVTAGSRIEESQIKKSVVTGLLMKMGEGVFVFNFSVKNVFYFRTLVQVFEHSDCRSHLIVSTPCIFAFLLLFSVFICSDTAIKLKQKCNEALTCKVQESKLQADASDSTGCLSLNAQRKRVY